jgi:hypothetical protein
MVDDSQNLGETVPEESNTKPAHKRRRRATLRDLVITLKIPALLAKRLKARVFSVRKFSGLNQKTYSMNRVLMDGLKAELDRLDKEEHPSMSLI